MRPFLSSRFDLGVDGNGVARLHKVSSTVGAYNAVLVALRQLAIPNAPAIVCSNRLNTSLRPTSVFPDLIRLARALSLPFAATRRGGRYGGGGGRFGVVFVA